MSENESQCLLYVIRSAYYALFVLEGITSKLVTIKYDEFTEIINYTCNSCGAMSSKIELMIHKPKCAHKEQFTAYASLKLALNLWSKYDVLGLLRGWQKDHVS